MAAQLEGVLREVTSKLRGTPTAGASTCFTGESGRAASTSGWRSLPVPLVSPDDPEAAVVVTLGAMEPEAVVDALGELADRGVEVELRRVRALIDLDRLDEANGVLDEHGRDGELPGARPDWRVGWYRGVAALAAGAPDERRASWTRSTGTCPVSWRPSWPWPTPRSRPATTRWPRHGSTS